MDSGEAWVLLLFMVGLSISYWYCLRKPRTNQSATQDGNFDRADPLTELAEENEDLREHLESLQEETGLTPTGQPSPRPKTYRDNRFCPQGHAMADDERFCRVCGLTPEGDPWVEQDPRYNGATPEMKSQIAENERLREEIESLETKLYGEGNDDPDAPREDSTVAQDAIDGRDQEEAEGPVPNEETADGEEEIIAAAQGIGGELVLFPNELRLVIDGETTDIPIRRIASVLFVPANEDEPGSLRVFRFLEETTRPLDEILQEKRMLRFALYQQADFATIWEELESQITTYDNGELPGYYDWEESEAPAPSAPIEATAPPAAPDDAVSTTAANQPMAASPPAPPVIPPAAGDEAKPIPTLQGLSLPSLAAEGSSETIWLAPDSIQVTSNTSGERRELLLKHVTWVELQSAAGNTFGEGYIHFHRLIDDKDLARAVPSAFPTISSDWGRVDQFRVAFREDQEPAFLQVKTVVERCLEALEATTASLPAFLARLEKLEGIIAELKNASVTDE